MSQEIKKLYRSKSDRKIAGVCGGLGVYLNADSTIIRAIFVLMALFSGIGIILYIALAIITPQDGEPEGTVSGFDQSKK